MSCDKLYYRIEEFAVPAPPVAVVTLVNSPVKSHDR